METENLIMVIGIFLLVYFAVIFGLFTYDKFFETPEDFLDGPIFDPVKIILLKAWNYENLDVNIYYYSGCVLNRLGPDEWKINFKECT